MTLFDLLTAILFVAPIVTGVATGWKQGGLAGLLVGVVAGLIVGVVNVPATRRVATWLVRRFPPGEGTLLSEAFAMLVYLAFLPWALGSGFLVDKFTEFVVQAFAA